MATSYTVLSITDEIASWLKEKEVTYSQTLESSRYPTPNEIRNVLDGLSDCKAEYTISAETWQAVISDAADRWASLIVLDFHGQEGEQDTYHKFYFEKGWPELMARILRGLAVFCGPFVLMSNSDLTPLLIFPESDK